MTTVAQSMTLTSVEVERASELDGKNYELDNGVLSEKKVGVLPLFIATRIAERLNAHFYPYSGMAVVEGMIYCFGLSNHGRKPDVSYVALDRLPDRRIPEGDLYVVPDLIVEVLSPGNTGIEIDRKLGEYFDAKAPMVWIVNPPSRTIRVCRGNGTVQVFHAADVIESEPLLPAFVMKIADVFSPE